MQIKLNDNFIEIEPGTTLATLLKSINLHQQKGIAVAVNNNVVPREKWPDTPVNDNDSLLIIGATYGG